MPPVDKVTPDVLHIDFETFSECDLKKAGAHKYFAHPSTTVLCAAWAFNAEEPVIWLPGQELPARVVDHILEGGTIEAWNAQFERLCFNAVMGPKFGWPVPDLEQFDCVMVRAAAMAFPLQLGKAAIAIGLERRKDDVGSRVMLQLCKPRKTSKKNKETTFSKERFPFKYETLYAYCIQDVRVEQAMSARLTKLKPAEKRRYVIDQRCNDRGVPIDIALIHRAQKIVDQTLLRLNREMKEVTDGCVPSCNAVAQLKAWLVEGGIPCESVDKDHILRLLARDDLSNSQRVAILLRQEAAKTSTAKLNSFESHMSDDGTVKGTLQFNGAMTGRDAARGVQVQNFPRPNPKTDVLAACKDIMDYDADMLECMHGPPMSIVADCLRSMIVARPGHTLFSGDLASIEARLTAYIAGQEDKVQAFRNFDAKTGPDIYIVSAAGIYNVEPKTISKEDERRQVGKVADLSLGFGGGAGAFGSMAKLYRVDLVPLFPIAWDMADVENRERASEAWIKRGKKAGMRKEAWLAAELTKMAWREVNNDTVLYWRALENAAIDAMLQPGQTFRARDVRYRRTGSFLRCILPSGRSIFYPFPRLEEVMTPWGKQKLSIRFFGMDSFTRQWKEFHMYGGFQHQNVVQSTARDVMWEAVERCEAAGYPNIMRVHDEPVCEVVEGFGSEKEFHRLMVEVPTWAPGLPIAASCWSGPRYRK